MYSYLNLILLLSLSFCLNGLVRCNTDDGIFTAYCDQYCDRYGYLVQGQECISTEVEIYCCGEENYRYCCTEAEQSIDGEYGPEENCSSSWLFKQPPALSKQTDVKHCPCNGVTRWRIILVMLLALVIILACATCCYYCSANPNSSSRSRVTIFGRFRRRNDDISTIAASNTENQASSSTPAQPTFDPDSPFAFAPPEYESLPKDPPKYSEVFLAGEGQSNPTFEDDTGSTGSASPALANSPESSEPPKNETTVQVDDYETIELSVPDDNETVEETPSTV